MKVEDIIIQYWITERDRDSGESSIHIPSGETEDDVIEEAKQMFLNYNYAAVEVIYEEEEDVIYHISNTIPKGERY
jgi:hypothetical protein